MRLTSTLLECMQKNPKGLFANPTVRRRGSRSPYFQDGVTISYVEHFPKGIEVVENYEHPSSYSKDTDHDIMIYFGSQCPYIERGIVYYIACVFFWPGGCGGSRGIPRFAAEDRGWVEMELVSKDGGTQLIEKVS